MTNTVARLREAEAKLTDPKAFLFTWGYHQLWHGAPRRKDLDASAPLARSSSGTARGMSFT